MKRRDFLQLLTGAAAATSLPRISVGAEEKGTVNSERPNILWISCEDMSPDMGCYGDPYAVTPNLDRLAAQGARYDSVFSHSGVCAPTRSGIITGMYPTTIGTHHMRCEGVPPAYVKCFTEYLRAAGYYCTNNAKTDYQFAAPLTAWDANNNRAHWRGRSEGQPFFSVFNLTISHESQIRNRNKRLLDRIAELSPHEKHDPAKAVLPPYYPDTPLVRQDWAQYYDIVTLMDKEAGRILEQLEEDGLADDTIVWFWGDHGRGLPRAKRWIYDSGLRVPLIIRVPEKYRLLATPDNPDAVGPGTVNDDLVAFIDFAPTMLSVADVKVPEHMQGQPFLGRQKAAPREYIFAARDRMDERYDIIRAVRDRQYKYIRNYMPHVTYGQDIDYMNQMPTMQEMRRLNAEGKLVGPQQHYFLATKPIEELYDTRNDPHEVNNLADDHRYKQVLERMRRVHLEWMKETGDVGLIPEPELDEMKRPGGEWQKTEAPTFGSRSGGARDKGATVSISCVTPGASIAYATGDGKGSRWELYTEPLLLEPGQALRAKACRIGFSDSEEVRFGVGDDVASSEKPEPAHLVTLHWRDRIDKTDLPDRLRAIKMLDGMGTAALPTYLGALNDADASVRYWGIVGAHTTCQDPETIGRAKEAIGKLLDDPSPIVRIAAAHALCDWGEDEAALPVLIQELASSSDTVRLSAAITLGRIGDKARPALPQLKAAMKDKQQNVRKVTKYTLQRLEHN